MRPFVFTIVSLALAAPIVAAPLATSTPVTLPGVMTATVGLIGPSEVPNVGSLSKSPGLPAVPGLSNIPGLSSGPPALPGLPRASRGIDTRQIRIADEDVGPDMMNTTSGMDGPSTFSQDSSSELGDDATKFGSQAEDGTLVRRQVRLMGHEVGAPSDDDEVSDLEDPAILKRAEPSAAPAPPSIPAAGTEVAASALLALGEVRTNISEIVHSFLSDGFGGQDTAGASADTLQDAVANVRRDATPSSSAPPAKFLAEGTGPVERTQLMTRHSLMLDTDALFPEAPDPASLTSTAAPTPIQAWQNMGFVDIDSNQAPPDTGYVQALPKNATGLVPSSAVPSGATSALPTGAVQTAASVADAKVGNNVASSAHSA